MGWHDAAHDETAIVDEAPAAAVGRAERPERERVQPRRSADRRPRVGVARPEPVALERRVDEQLTVGRQVALLREDPPSEPGAFGEHVAIGVPEGELTPRRGAPPDDDGDVRVPGHDDEEARGWRGDGHGSQSSAPSAAAQPCSGLTPFAVDASPESLHLLASHPMDPSQLPRPRSGRGHRGGLQRPRARSCSGSTRVGEP